MISLNYKDSRPIYEQIKDSFRKLVISGALRPADKLPSVREMAAELAINPNTIQRAYREMEAEGLIYSVAGKGSFIAELAESDAGRRQDALKSFDELVRELRFLGLGTGELKKRIDELESEWRKKQ